MMRSVQLEVSFRVAVTTKPGEVVCITGEGRELGEWSPYKARRLKRDTTVKDHEVWQTTLKMEGKEAYYYRYFTCVFLEAEHEETEPDLIVTRWETNIHPRRFSPHDEANKEETESIFGDYDHRCNSDQGWLTGQTEVNIRLHSNPIHMWKPRYQQQTYSIKCTPMDLRYRDTVGQSTDDEGHDEFDEDEDTMTGLPPVRGLKSVQVSSLVSDDSVISADQGDYGMVYEQDSYIVFKTQNFEPEFMGFTIDFYVHRTSSNRILDPPKHVGYAYVLPVNFKETMGRKTVPVSGLKHRPIGQIRIEYLIVKPLLGVPQTMEVSYAKHWKWQRRPLDVGHRGMGVSYKAKELRAAIQENTIASLATAGSHGADMVEFDVQLTKDLTPVIYHDFTVCLTMKKKGNPPDIELFKVPVKDLTLAQLQQLKLSHSSHNVAVDGSDSLDHPEHRPFPSLQEAFQLLEPHIGFNIEIKYAMLLKDGFYEEDQEHYTERNKYVDIILKDVLEHAGTRRIIFSCFDPDVCIMLRRKQNKYPVLFLTMALTEKYEPFEDKRTHNVGMAMKFGLSENLLGINVHTEELLLNKNYIPLCKDKGLVLFCWGEDNNDTANILELKELGVEGVIYDRINDFKGSKDNVFKMEHEAKIKLLQQIRGLDDSSCYSIDSGIGMTDSANTHPLCPRKRTLSL